VSGDVDVSKGDNDKKEANVSHYHRLSPFALFLSVVFLRGVICSSFLRRGRRGGVVLNAYHWSFMAGIVWNKSAYILFAKFESPKIYFTCAQTLSCPRKHSF
jgi:hypothetical protein